MASRVKNTRRNSANQRLLSQWPKPAIYARYLKSLFRGEIEVRLLPWLCERSLASIDIGAHHGIYSLGTSLFSKRVIAIEPQSNLANALRRALPRSASVIEAALSNRSGTANFIVPVDEWDSTAHLSAPAGAVGEQRVGERCVQLMRLDDIVTEAVGFVKIDVEGHEVEVLEGATKTIAANKPALLIEVEERHQAGSINAVASLLENFRYQGFFVCRDEIRPIHEFDARIHQVPSTIRDADRISYREYINNFIFVQEDAVLPRRVPSPWRALAGSVHELS